MLDISTSMSNIPSGEKNRKAKSLAEAMNDVISTIKNYNSNNRVGIVTFLAGSTVSIDSNSRPSYAQRYGCETNASTLVGLTKVSNIGTKKGYTDAADYGNDTSPRNVYYSILTAKYYKGEMAKAYEADARFYTLGIGMNSKAAKALLDPTSSNINGYSGLSSLFGGCTSGHDYADMSFVGFANSEAIKADFKTMISTSQVNTELPASKRTINANEISQKYIDINDSKIITSKPFTIIVNGTTKCTTWQQALDKKYVNYNSTLGYYVDLNVTGTNKVQIKYHVKQ